MGVIIFWIIIALVVVLGQIMPQQGPKKKKYIILMMLIHVFVCGWRYRQLTGDLKKYTWGYYNTINKAFFSEELFNEGRNFGFEYVKKIVAVLSNYDFQMLLIVIAIITEISIAIIIFRYSSKPWLSYLMWDCVGFYLFGFSAIKQALAMAILMFAFDAIMNNKLGKFLFWTLLASCIHAPALVFLPAYWIANSKKNFITITFFLILFAIIFVYKYQIADYISDFYYEDTLKFNDSKLGGRFFAIALIAVSGIILRGIKDRQFTKVFSLMATAAALQMFGTFDNIFTRLTDYYLQFVIVFVPMMLELDNAPEKGGKPNLVPFKPAITCGILIFSLWFYNYSGLAPNANLSNCRNYEFCWQNNNTFDFEDFVAAGGIKNNDYI